MKRKISTFVLTAVMAVLISVPVMASEVSPFYWEGGREVQYFSYATKASSYITTFSDTVSQKMYQNRQWVVSLSNNGGASYKTAHALFRHATGSVQAGAQCWISGTGNGGGTFSDDWGFANYPYYVIGSRLDTRETGTKTLSGQFSADAPY